MPKMTEEEKKIRRENKEAQMKKIRADEELKRLEWIATYPERVKEYRARIKAVGLEENIKVDDNLVVMVGINPLGESYYNRNKVTVGSTDFFFDEEFLDPTTQEWEYESKITRLNEIQLAREARSKYLREVKAFKDSLTKDQLAMVKDFNLVL